MSAPKQNSKNEQEDNNGGELTTTEKVIAGVAVVGAAALAYGLSKLIFSGSGDRKTMAAPGRSDGSRIFRDVFEKDPASYFRDLHKKK